MLDLDALSAERGLVPRPRQYIRRLSDIGRDYVDFSLNPGARVRTGWPWIDGAIKGIAPGELACWAAGLYTGKTAILCNLAVNNPDLPTVFFSLEMPDIMLYARLYSMQFEQEFRTLEDRIRKDGALRERVLRDLDEALPRLGISQRSGLTVDQLGEGIDEYEQVYQESARFVMVDYAELLSPRGELSETHGMDGRFDGLLRLAKDRNVALMVTHQLNREYLVTRSGCPVRMSDLRYGGESKVSYLLAAYRRVNDLRILKDPMDSLYHKTTIHFQILKNRSGEPRGVAEGEEFSWDTQTMRVREKEFRL